MRKLVIGIDSGTQSTKALVVDADKGEVLGEASAAYGLIEGLPAGSKEQDPQTWTDALEKSVTGALKKARVRSGEVVAIGVSGQQHGFVPLDSKGDVIRPAKLWCDTSTIEECEILTEGIGGKSKAIKAIGNASTMHPNTVNVQLSNSKRSVSVTGESLGGGAINISKVDGFKAGFSARMHTLIIKADDVKGMIAFVANVISQDDCNIANMSVSRKGKNELACHVIEMDSGLNTTTLAYLRSLKPMKEIIYIPDIDI